MSNSKTDVLIVGAGGMGREVWDYLEHKRRVDAHFAATCRPKGFLDDDPHALDGYDYPGGIIGSIADYEPADHQLLVCAIGSPAIKAKVCPVLKERGARFLTLAHPTAMVGHNAAVGEGVVLGPYSLVAPDAKVGDFVFLNCYASCGHDASIGDYSTLSPYSGITGFAELGERVFMGSHATVVPGRRVGAGSNIGAASAVVTHLPADSRVLGVPAKPFMRG
ncbi:acetyltransferase [Ruficoccus sp. ZRK36]|uniref:acetyltransferase n=1 Tax=Ruficoccus sp. ZRK36 TaxID=2866311 RepID=UPI001C72A836|nr:acetyltransferase [Ruficoccus sp. ZRK36]QYY36187.1 acetyltransferase [Ruficoccus sp. ZRK36]